MPEHIWSVLCYKGCLDKYTNQVSLLDVIEGAAMVADKQPDLGTVLNFHIPINLVTLWLRTAIDEPESFRTRLVIVTPDGHEYPNRSELPCDLIETPRLRTFLRIQGLPYQGNGMYRVNIECQDPGSTTWRRVSSMPLELTITLQAPTQPAKTPEASVKPLRKRRRARIRN